MDEFSRADCYDLYGMEMALVEARKAYCLGEVPVGAVILKEGTVVGRGHNLKETLGDPTAHAEMMAIREAARNVTGWRVLESTMYVTLEPCPMCAGAIVMARIPRLVIGTKDPKTGACGSLWNIAVSYTHLDVYKRQTLRRMGIPEVPVMMGMAQEY